MLGVILAERRKAEWFILLDTKTGQIVRCGRKETAASFLPQVDNLGVFCVLDMRANLEES